MRPFQDEQDIERQWASIRDDILRRGADLATAEDIAQETWLCALRRPPKEHGRLRGWMHVVAGRLIRQARRAERNRADRERDLARHEETDDALREPSLLQRYVRELGEPYRTVLHMRFYEDRDVPEIAMLLARHEATVRTQLKRGLDRLGARVGGERARPSRLLGLLGWLRPRSRGVRSNPGRHLLRVAGIAGVSLLLIAGALWRADRAGSSQGELLAASAPEALPARVLEAPAPLPARESAPPEPEPVAMEVGPKRLRGIVRAPDGAPLPGALVHSRPARSDVAALEALADERGRFEIAAGDDDLVWATHPDWNDSARCYVASARRFAELELRLGAVAGRLQVEITDSHGDPVAGARILVDPLSSSGQLITERGTLEFASAPAPVVSAADGSAALRLPDDESAELVVLAEGFAPWRGTVLREERELDIELAPPARVRGVLVEPDGFPVAGGTVEVLQLGGLAHWQGVTDLDGRFEVTGPMAGEFAVRCAEPAETGTRSVRWEGRLAEGKDAELGSLELEEAYTLTGLVLEHGRPVADAAVTFMCYTAYAPCELLPRTLHTDARGRFAFTGNRKRCPGRICVLPEGTRSGAFIETKAGVQDLVLAVESDAPRAPLELEFLADEIPLLVELRAEPNISVRLVDGGAVGRFRSPPMPKGRYGVVGFSPEFGVWVAATLEHDPGAPELHSLRSEDWGRLTVELDLPPGIDPRDVEVAVRCQSFNAYGLEGTGWMQALRQIPWDPERHAFSARVPAGTHALVVRAPGLASLSDVVRVDAGAGGSLRLHPVPGVEVRLTFRCPRVPQYGTTLRLDVETPTGIVPLLVGYDEQHATTRGVWADTRLPLDATRVNVRSEARLTDHGCAMKGSRAIAPDELLAARSMPALEIRLEPVR